MHSSPNKQPAAPPSPPDNWQSILWIMFASQLTTAIGFSVFFPFLPLFVEELGSVWNIKIDILVALAFSAQAISMMIASPLWGALADRIGRKPMVLRATFGGAILMILMAFSSSAEELVWWRFVQGAVTGVMVANNALVASLVPKERSGYALGLMQTGLWSGIAIGPLLGGFLQDSLGMQAAFFVTSLMLLIAGALVLFGVQENFQPQAVEDNAGQPRGFAHMWEQWRTIFQANPMPTLFATRFIYFLGRGFIAPYAVFIMQLLIHDASRLGTMTGLMIGLGSVAGTLSAVFLGRLGDDIGHRKVLLYSAILGGCCYFPQAWASSATELIMWNVGLGIAAGGVLPAISAMINQYTIGNNIGAAFGLDNAIGSGARAVSPLLAALVVLLFGYRGVFIASGIAFLLIGAVVIIQLDENQEVTDSRQPATSS